MRVQSLALLAGATTAIAAETVTLFLPGFDSQDLVGKVLGTSAKATTYLLNCPDSTDSEDCGVPGDGLTVIQASSSISLGYSFEAGAIAEKCTYDSVTISCAISMDEDGLTTSFSTAVPITELPGVMMPVTITGTGTASAAATTGASVSASTAASTGTATLTTSASTGTTATDSAAATSQSETGNAAMPMITGNARWAAGGVAAALAFAAL